MKITGIIAEYNPFHHGHAYHLAAARAVTGADYCIAVMSGNFVQRGAPAMINKYHRTQMALLGGADLVIELPLYYACASAEFFALGAISLLDRLGAVDYLCFGSESGQLLPLQTAAQLLTEESPAYQEQLQQALRQGYSFPAARSLALSAVSSGSELSAASPNDLLGIEYLKALSRRNSSIRPYTIQRTGAGYHDMQLTASTAASPAFSSASAIRNHLGNLPSLADHVPPYVYQILTEAQGKAMPIESRDFSLLLHYRLLHEAGQGYGDYLDVSIELEHRILRSLNHFQDFEQFCALLKTKNLTYSRIRRSLLHILLDLKNPQMQALAFLDYIPYARVLGFRKTAAPLLSLLKAHTSIPLLTKLSRAQCQLSPKVYSLLEHEITAAHIYESVQASKYGQLFCHEYTRPLVITDPDSGKC